MLALYFCKRVSLHTLSTYRWNWQCFLRAWAKPSRMWSRSTAARRSGHEYIKQAGNFETTSFALCGQEKWWAFNTKEATSAVKSGALHNITRFAYTLSVIKDTTRRIMRILWANQQKKIERKCLILSFVLISVVLNSITIVTSFSILTLKELLVCEL